MRSQRDRPDVHGAAAGDLDGLLGDQALHLRLGDVAVGEDDGQHVLEEVDAVCSRAIVIARGKKIADGTPKDLERRSGYYNSVSVHLHPDDIEGLRGALEGMNDISGIEVGNIDGALAQVTVMSREGATIVETVNTRIRENGISVEQLYVERGRLDDVFRQITSDGGAG